MDFKDQLIKLGKVRPELRPHIRPVLAELEKEATEKFTVHGNSLESFTSNLELQYLTMLAGDIYAFMWGNRKLDVTPEHDPKSGVVTTDEGWAVQVTRGRSERKPIAVHILDENNRTAASIEFVGNESTTMITKKVIKKLEDLYGVL